MERTKKNNEKIGALIADIPQIGCAHCGYGAGDVAAAAEHWSTVGDPIVDPICCETTLIDEENHD